ncbi:MAG TPA: large-conductance mechanosensitive channel protein MscL, partial [Gemmataceae bacterium]|jgi:large conductance mechanosensitive channel|nr:large-conductance mechanosensitive channel protein MscL [Gemmataceae bacterium]
MALTERVTPVWRESLGLIGEFKAFIRRGNVIDLAVGVIMGAAFGKIVSSLVGDVIMPPIGWALGNVDFKDLAVTLRAASPEIGPDGKALQPAIAIAYGRFLQALIDFVLIAFCVFVLVKLVNRMHRPTAEIPKAPSDEVKLLTEIRDLLKANSPQADVTEIVPPRS